MCSDTKYTRDEPNGTYFSLGWLYWDDWLEYSKKIPGMNPMGLSAPWDDYIEMIALQLVIVFQGIKPMGLSDHWFNYLEVIA